MWINTQNGCEAPAQVVKQKTVTSAVTVGKLCRQTEVFPPGLGKSVEHKLVDLNYSYIFTDGGCEFMGTEGATAGFGVYFADRPNASISKHLPEGKTNNYAEFSAIICALQNLDP